MSILHDTYTLFVREMLIFKKNYRTSIIRSIIFPVVLIFLLGNIGNTPSHIPVAIVNYDGGARSMSLISALSSSTAVTIAAVTNQDAAMQMLAQGTVSLVLIIPPGFSSLHGSTGLIEYVDTSSPIGAESVQSAISGVASTLGAPSISVQSPNSPGTITISTNYAYGASSSYKNFLIAGLVVMVSVFGSMWSGGISLLTDRQLGNIKAFMATPINKLSILLSKIASGTLQSMIYGLIALGIGFLDGATLASGIAGMPAILWFMFLGSLAFSGVATAIAVKIAKVEVFSIFGMAITMPMWFLSGAFLPTSTLPGFLQPVSAANPMTYGVNAVRDIMLKGFIGTGAFLFDSIVLIVFAIITISISAFMFRKASII